MVSWMQTRALMKADETARKSVEIAGEQANVLTHQLEHNRVVERAYVKISHKEPGLVFTEARTSVQVTVEVKNWGRTPAQVSEVLLKIQSLAAEESLPSPPDYSVTWD